MIKANELRIGNWFFSNIYQQVDLQHLEYLQNEEFAPHDAMKPIPLTIEILQKAGFKDIEEELVIELEEGTSLIQTCFMDLWLIRTTRSWDQKGYSDLTIDGERLQFVHQLQNFYYCFTGKELEIIL